MKLTPHVHFLHITFQIPHPSGVVIERSVNVYLIFGDRVTVIDTGVAGSEKQIEQYLRREEKSLGSIGLILHTHAHPDHIGATKAIRDASGALIALHHREQRWLEDVEIQAEERPVPGFRFLVGGSVGVDRELREGDRITLGQKLHLLVIETPGHSPGSISLFLEEEGILFSGDLIPVPHDMPIYEDPALTLTSLRKIGEMHGIRMILSSWDEPRSGEDADESIRRGIEYVREIQRNVNEIRLAEPDIDIGELTRKVLKTLGVPETAMNPLVIKTIEGHLEKHDQEGNESHPRIRR